MTENFYRAIRDLDEGNMQGARQHILSEIQMLRGQVDPQAIVNKINRVENQPGHAHHDVQLVDRGYGQFDIAPVNYGPPPGEYRHRPMNPVVPFVEGAVTGAIIGDLLHRHQQRYPRNPYER